jgi:hypothetical protein
MTMGSDPHRTQLVERIWRERGQEMGSRFQLKAGLLFAEAPDNLERLFARVGTNGVDEHTTGQNTPRGISEHLQLDRRESVYVVVVFAPACVGMAAENAYARAGSVDEHPIRQATLERTSRASVPDERRDARKT